MKYQYTARHKGWHPVVAVYEDVDNLMDDIEERDHYTMTGEILEATTVVALKDGEEVWRVSKGSKQMMYDAVREML